jgi:hypothetical protein
MVVIARAIRNCPLLAFAVCGLMPEARAASFHTCPVGGEQFSSSTLTSGDDRWITHLPRNVEMLLTDIMIICRYGDLQLVQPRADSGCVMGAEGGQISSRNGNKVCTFTGDPAKRAPQHCYVACP